MRKKFKQKTIKDKVALGKKRTKKDSEFQSYTYIKNELKESGWNTKNPNRDPSGQLYTQQECLGNPEIKSMLGKLKPEYIVKLREDAFWVIEAKPAYEQINQAYEEAMEYGKLINKHKFIRAVIASGVAGNDIDRYLVKSGFWVEGKQAFSPVTYNEREITSLISPILAEKLLNQKSPHLKDLEINEEEYIKIAEQINQVFHEASIKKDARSGIVASILLSLLAETEPNYNAGPTTFVDDINSRAREVLSENKKGNFFEYVRIHLPEKIDAQRKFKEALVSAFFLLKKVNIKSAMEAGSDILGKFYESFLKYGNGAKDLGILLTPRHVTEFASEVLNVTHRDIVYDPTCGTGGFLVSAFYRVKKNVTPEQLNAFKQYGIFGIDQQPTITTLAIVNMIFRGDGKNNIINDNCLARALVPETRAGRASAKFVSQKEGLKHAQRPITKVLMNPPFALKKESEKEHKFVDHALEQMEDGGGLFSILPVSVMIERGKAQNWRGELLRNNTLLSVLTFPPDLFYQAGSSQLTVGIFVRKGIPHKKDQKVLWIRAINDGLAKKKRKRLPNPKVPNDLLKVKDMLQSFIQNPKVTVKNIPEFQKTTPINFGKTSLELVPEEYLDEREPTEKEMRVDVENSAREMVAFLIRTKKEKIIKKLFLKNKKVKTIQAPPDYKYFDLKELFEPIKGKGDYLINLERGDTPLISATNVNNGVLAYVDLKPIFKAPLTTVERVSGTAFIQLQDFVTVPDDIMILKPLKDVQNLEFLVYVSALINKKRWKYSYGRKLSKSRLKEMRLYLPIDKEGNINYPYISEFVRSCYGWKKDIH